MRLTVWTLEAKRILKEYVEIIKGNEATVLALYQVAPFHSLGKPDELKKLLASLKEKPKVSMIDIRSINYDPVLGKRLLHIEAGDGWVMLKFEEHKKLTLRWDPINIVGRIEEEPDEQTEKENKE